MTAKIRFIFRLLCIAGCLLYGMAEMFFLFPFYSSKRKLRAIQLWSLRVLASCGMKLQTFGTPPQEGRGQMLISNHISWLDIMAVNGAFPGRFVAKDDVAKWPVVGYLATQAQTVYVSRNRGIKGNSAKIAGVTEALKNGDTVTISPKAPVPKAVKSCRSNPAFFRRPMMQAYRLFLHSAAIRIRTAAAPIRTLPTTATSASGNPSAWSSANLPARSSCISSIRLKREKTATLPRFTYTPC